MVSVWDQPEPNELDAISNSNASNDTKFGDRMRRAREGADLTLADVGKLFGVTPQAVQQWEKGKTEPSRETLVEFAQLTNVDFKWLVGYMSADDKSSSKEEIIGNKIKDLRESLGETQEIFGERFGVEQGTVSRWEAGSEVQYEHKLEIAALANTCITDFFELGDLCSKKRLDNKTAQDKIGFQHHPLIDGLFLELPSAGSEWDIDDRAEWLRTMAQNFKIVFGRNGEITILVDSD